MLKNVFLYVVVCILLTIKIYALNNDSKLQILAKTIETNGSIVTATGNVFVYSPTYYITANKILYDKKKNTLELFDNVNIIKNEKTTFFSNYAFLDFSYELDKFKPVLLVDNINNVWINSKNAEKKNQILNLEHSTLSSCDCYDPAWSINFTTGDYNTTDQWINTYNVILFINEIPVFYTPYFGFSINTTRRTGLLKPIIGWSKDEGFLYAQPIYYAPKLNWDIEYIPQLRTLRGNGHHLIYRLKDTPNSIFKFKMGSFKEKIAYLQKYN
jgi:LPS-assembly protein